MSKKMILFLISLSLGFSFSKLLASETRGEEIICLNSDHWRLGTDPDNQGKEQNWWQQPQPDARLASVPGILQLAFPDYHGLVWYWREFEAPQNTYEQGRYLLRFRAVDYKADVWLNDRYLGSHEGGESAFAFDVTDVVKVGQSNLLAVRVLNPTHEPIDGITLNETAHRNKNVPMALGSDANHGGIVDSVELLITPAIYLTDIYIKPDWQTGKLDVETTIMNSTLEAGQITVEYIIAPARSGETIQVQYASQKVLPGENSNQTQLQVVNPHLWELSDPYLYRITVRINPEGKDSVHEIFTRFGFRDFRFENGYFRLNGKRLFLKSSHTGNCYPISQHRPHDPDLMYRDLLNSKAMGFNMVRFISGVAWPEQLDYCDEIGLMVYEESYAAWCMGNSSQMQQRYNESVGGMIHRDRNHPCVTIWGLLNENFGDPVFQHALTQLPFVRSLDDTRMVFLNSGNSDFIGPGIGGLEFWRVALGDSLEKENQILLNLNQFGPYHIVGPFENTGPDGKNSGLQIVNEPEKKVDLKASYLGKGDKEISWQEVPVADARNMIDLTKICGQVNYAVAYAYTSVEAPADMNVILQLGSDDGIAVWLNGIEIFRNEVIRASSYAQERIPVFLHQGRNEILLKIDQNIGGWNFYLDFSRGMIPCVAFNSNDRMVEGLSAQWQPGQAALHPAEGSNGSKIGSAIRWTAPADGEYAVAARFQGISDRTAADVSILHNKTSIFREGIGSDADEITFERTIQLRRRETLDFVVGAGGIDGIGGFTGLDLEIRSADGKVYNLADDFQVSNNPAGCWSYGFIPYGDEPDSSTFTLYTQNETFPRIGTYSNPHSLVWNDDLNDQHPYKRVPHTAEVIRTLRSAEVRERAAGLGDNPVFISEYGIGSANNPLRLVRLYEQNGKTQGGELELIRSYAEQYLHDWQRWDLAGVFGYPEAFFQQSIARMAGQRTLGFNAIRSNPYAVGYSLTGTVDQGLPSVAEGLTNAFRELKPGTMDAVFGGLALLRWCTFVEPVNIYRGETVTAEVVLANEDVLKPGDYPARVYIFGPDQKLIYEQAIQVAIPETSGTEPPFAVPVFKQQIQIDAPTGPCRLVVNFEQGAAAAGGQTEFYVFDPADMPAVNQEVVLWAPDEPVESWLREQKIPLRIFDPQKTDTRELILVTTGIPREDRQEAFGDLAARIARGSSAVFLCPEVFARGDQSTGWAPLKNKGTAVPGWIWLYHPDQWAQKHPIFAGLQAGGLMDYTYYREIISDTAWVNMDDPKIMVAGSIDASTGYGSGMLVGVYELGAGQFILNTLWIRENLGAVPQAERLLRNMLNFAGQDIHEPVVELPSDGKEQLHLIGLD